MATGAASPQTGGAHPNCARHESAYNDRRFGMRPLTKAIAVALIQVLIVCSLGAKLLYDRRTRPQAWFQTARYDPNLPIRGRYLSLQLQLNDSRSPEEIEK